MRKLSFISIFFVIILLSVNFVESKPRSNDINKNGYVGTLPDLENKYGIIEDGKSKVEVIPSKEFNSANEIKPVPKDNPTFVNIILKQDKTSQYVNDMNDFIPILESICDIIDNKNDVQVFNAKIYFFNKNADYFREKYDNKPESQFVSYKKLLELNMHTKSVALLRTEAKKYNPYLAYQGEGYIYSPENIDEQLDFLKDEIEQTILILRESN